MRDRWFDRRLAEFVTVSIDQVRDSDIDALAMTMTLGTGPQMTGICIGKDCGRAIHAFTHRDLDALDEVAWIWLGLDASSKFNPAYHSHCQASLRQKLSNIINGIDAGM